MKLLLCALACLPLQALGAGFKTLQEKGVWWLQDPKGKKMLSLGVDCVGPGPKAEEALKRPQYSADAMGDSYDAWRQRTMGRLDAWGFNTLAGWCDPALSSTAKPFTPVLHIQATMGSIWWDLWGSDYEGQAAKITAAAIKPYLGNPMVIGYFIDNELAWADDYLLKIALTWDAKAPGKKKLVELMKKLYKGDFKAFGSDFETRGEAWDSLLPITDTARRDGRGHRVIDAWTYELARRYYTVTSAAIRKADPGKLVLGDRFRQYYPQAVARAAKGVLDVISTNYEATTADGWVSPSYFRTLHELSGLPILIGEFYSAARQNRSGNKNHEGAFTLVDTQGQRARAVRAQAEAFARMPYVVGWHWFQFNDEPVNGRDDGEDYNMGLVDIHDEPYAEITTAFSWINSNAAAMHSEAPAPRPAEFPLQVAKRNGLLADGKLGDWDKAQPLPSQLLKLPEGLLPFGEFWLAWDQDNLWIAARAYDLFTAGSKKPEADKEESWGELQRLELSAEAGQAKAAFYGATGYSAEEKAAFFCRPPAKGHFQAAAGTFVDKWHACWELAIPASELGLESLKAGQRLALSLKLQNRGDFEEMELPRFEFVLK